MICPIRDLSLKKEKSSSATACPKGESAANVVLNLVYKLIIGVKLILKYHKVCEEYSTSSFPSRSMLGSHKVKSVSSPCFWAYNHTSCTHITCAENHCLLTSLTTEVEDPLRKGRVETKECATGIILDKTEKKSCPSFGVGQFLNKSERPTPARLFHSPRSNQILLLNAEYIVS